MYTFRDILRYLKKGTVAIVESEMSLDPKTIKEIQNYYCLLSLERAPGHTTYSD